MNQTSAFATNRRRIAFAALLLVALSSAGRAQTARITFEPAPAMPPVVDDRPAVTDWIAHVEGASLVEGRMELEVIANGQFLGRVLSDELVLSGADQKVRILLPAFNWFVGADEIVVSLKFHAKEGVYRLPEQRLRTSLPYKKRFPLLLAETTQRRQGTMGRDALGDRLRFESLLPEMLRERAVTVMSHLPANDFPQEPLAYCHYEAVAVAGDAFGLLRPNQLDALLKWVRAGGSLYLEPAGLLQAWHVEFLNRLAAGDERKLVFDLDDKGRFPASLYLDASACLLLRPGLGCAVLTMPDEAPLDDETWRRAAATLWKFRSDLLAVSSAADPPEMPPGAGAMGGGAAPDSPYGYSAALDSPSLSDVSAEMVDWLRPQGVQMVPLWVIGLMLGTLVLMIGPVDYFVLGWLKRRKWTWITFPSAVLAMTGLTVSVTNSYLSSAEARKALVIHDVANDGEVVRSNRFELVFTSATRRLNTDVHGALFTPLLTGGMVNVRSARPVAVGQQVVYVSGPDGRLVPTVRRVVGSESTHSEPVSVQGRVPTRFRVTQDVRQWTPRLNRWFSIGPPAEGREIAWESLAVPQVSEPTALSTLRATDLLQQVRAQLGPRAHIVLAASSRLGWNSELEDFSAPAPTTAPRYDPDGNVSFTNMVFARSSALLRLSSAQPYGLAAFTSCTSPHGGRSLDDLPLGIQGIDDRWWLFIILPQGDDVVVYRRSFPYSR